MRYTIILTIILFLGGKGIAQNKIKLKKGKVYQNDDHIASYDGKGGAFRNFTITITGTDEKPLATMQEFIHDFNIPWETERRWMTLEFPNLPGKILKLQFDPRERTESRLVKLLFNDSLPFIIKENTIDASALDQWIAKKNYDFTGDSTYTRKMQGEIIEAMKENLARDKTLPLQIIKTSESAFGMSATANFDIKQGEIKLGRIIKTKSSGSFGSNIKYEVWKIVAKPYVVGNGKETLSVALLANFISGKGTYLVPAGNIVDAKITNQDAAEYQLADWLIKSGYL